MGGGLLLLNKAKAQEEQRIVLQGNQNNVIIIGAGLLGMPSDDLKTIIDSVIAKNLNVPGDAVRAVRPAKREEGASIQSNYNADISISAPAVQAMPSYASEDDEIESIEDFKSVELLIRATDLDSTKRGWAAVLPSISNQRVKLHLDPHIRPDELIAKPHIKCDVTVVFKYDGKGDKYPSLVFLREIEK